MMLGLLDQNKATAAAPGLLGLDKNPMMLMALGASLLQSGQSHQPGRALSDLIGTMQNAQNRKLAQEQAQKEAAFRQAQLDFQKHQFAQMQAQRQAALGVQQGQLGLAKQRLGLNQQQFGLLQKQYQDHLKGVEGLKANIGVLSDEEKGIEGTGLLGGKLTPQQFKTRSALSFLQSRYPQGSVAMINQAYPGSPTSPPTTLQKNLAAAGYKPGTPEYQAAIKQSVMKPNSDSQAQVKTKLLEADVDKIKRYDKLGEQAASNLERINQFKQALTQVETGKFAPMKLTAGQIDQGLTGGLLTDKKAVGAAELIRTFSTEFMLQFIARTKGAISERENQLFMNASPGLDKTPEGNLRIANAMEAVNQRFIEKSSFMRQYLQTHNTLSGAEAAWRRFIDENPILDADFRIHRKHISNWQGYLGQTHPVSSPNGSSGSKTPIRAASTSQPLAEPSADPLGLRP